MSCRCSTAVADMPYDEFVAWANEYITEQFLMGGLKGMRDAVTQVVQQQHMNQARNGGKFPVRKKD